MKLLCMGHCLASQCLPHCSMAMWPSSCQIHLVPAPARHLQPFRGTLHADSSCPSSATSCELQQRPDSGRSACFGIRKLRCRWTSACSSGCWLARCLHLVHKTCRAPIGCQEAFLLLQQDCCFLFQVQSFTYWPCRRSWWLKLAWHQPQTTADRWTLKGWAA